MVIEPVRNGQTTPDGPKERRRRGEASPIPDSGPLAEESAESALIREQMSEMMERLMAVRKRRKRHGIWALLGISPAAVLPAAGLLVEGSIGLLLLLGVLVTVTQGYSWTRSLREEEELEESLRRLGGEL